MSEVIQTETATGGIWDRIQRTPLYVRIVIALVLGAICGLLVGERASGLKEVSSLILSLLRTLATPLILLAILHSLITANVGGPQARKLAFLLITNTAAAIFIGLLVVNVVRPGTWGPLPAPTSAQQEVAREKQPYDALADLKNKIPTNIIKPLYDDNVISIIILAVTFGVAIRKVRENQIRENQTGYRAVEDFISTLFTATIVALGWIIQLVPIAVFCVVAAVVGKEGFSPLRSLGGFILAVLIALSLQAIFYITRVRLMSWVSPKRFLSGNRDALLTAFSTASSTVTMPITYAGLKDKKKIGVREQSASLGALVGANFNNDGTALYEAMAPLYIAQSLSWSLPIEKQIVIALMAVVASVGAAGIPEAGLVTMLLVFKSVNLPTEYVLLLLPVDWFLDRCRTALNVMGDMSVACILDGKTPEDDAEVTVSKLGEKVENI